jgi:hypothetical protein
MTLEEILEYLPGFFADKEYTSLPPLNCHVIVDLFRKWHNIVKRRLEVQKLDEVSKCVLSFCHVHMVVTRGRCVSVMTVVLLWCIYFALLFLFM